jgi:hypothetical protein
LYELYTSLWQRGGILIKKIDFSSKGEYSRWIFFVVLSVALSIWGPEAATIYKDKSILDKISGVAIETEEEGYRYTLSPDERLFLLSECLNSQSLPETEQNAMTREDSSNIDYKELEGAYAFVLNHRGPSGREITREEIFGKCNREIGVLKNLGILPNVVKEIEESDYDAVLYSAIDVLEPRNNVGVWKISLSNSQKNANKENHLIDTYVDGDTGKIYEFYVRGPFTWEEIDTDELIEKWRVYMGLGKPQIYIWENPLLETTPYFKKYVFAGSGEERTIVTIGFYEGIQELFLKISK